MKSLSFTPGRRLWSVGRGAAIFAICLLSAGYAGGGNPPNERADNAAPSRPSVMERVDPGIAGRAYRLTNVSAGPFRLGEVIRDTIAGFEVETSTERETLPGGVEVEIRVNTYHIGNEGWVRVSPQFDPATGRVSDKTGEIYIYSDLFLTDNGVGPISSLEDLAHIYPDIKIRYIGKDGMFAFVTPQLPNVQFLLSGEHYIPAEHGYDPGANGKPRVSDFRGNAHFHAVRIRE
ncbi:MAG: hypothetical protein NC210_06650 [[Clostridium] fimetarium]|nr:hypothetical protein [Alistipes timonensis]MCM1406083.1 hypothetical protein [[Clostridium] fimetarium]